MTEFTVDTNILIYSVDPTDELKHSGARQVMHQLYRSSGPLPMQCLSEFYGACVRKQHLRAIKGVSDVIHQALDTLRVVSCSAEDLLLAMDLHRVHGFQFFDCLLAATAIRSGCTVLFSEDFQHNYSLQGLTILNPFLLTSTELDLLLA